MGEVGLICVVGFCLGLRGEETLLIDLGGCRSYLAEGLGHATTPHVMVALWGRFKGVQGETHHLMPVVAVTASGLRPRDCWLVRLMSCLENLGITEGKLLQGKPGEQVKMGKFQEPFYSCLEYVQTTRPDLINPELEIREEYGISHSARMGVTTHARNMKGPDNVIEANNRWRKEESAR